MASMISVNKHLISRVSEQNNPDDLISDIHQ